MRDTRPVPDPTTIYHITCADNLPSVLDADGLLAYACLQERGVGHRSIANTGIQDRRSRHQVPIAPGGTVHDYVPFHFAPRSPMLYAIHRGRVAGYDGGQESVVYLVTTAQAVAEAGCAFVFTDGHAVMKLSAYSGDLGDLDRVDWPLMRDRMWTDTANDPDRKRRRQAEFLVHRRLPWSLVREVGVKTEAMRRRVAAGLARADHRPPVGVRREWYY